MKKHFNLPVKQLLSLSLILPLVLSLTACTSKEAIVPPDTITTTEEFTDTISTSIENDTTTDGTYEETNEPNSITEELYIPEGIDINSTLPGEEWVSGFVGNVNEPAAIIYNDNTGRKEVIQAGSKVTINPDEDIIAVYWGIDGMSSTPYAISVSKCYYYKYYEIYEFDKERLRSVPKRPASITVKDKGEEYWTIEFTMLVQ